MLNTTPTSDVHVQTQRQAVFKGHQITRLWVMNTYLVEEDDGLTLIDTGMSGSAEQILQAAQALGQPIRRILLTHAHTDHVGSLDALMQRLPEVDFLCSAQTARFLRGDLGLEAGQAETPLKGGFVRCQSAPTRTVKPGDSIGSLQVVAAAGHSPDQIAFLDPRDGTLYAGDAFPDTRRVGRLW